MVHRRDRVPGLAKPARNQVMTPKIRRGVGNGAKMTEELWVKVERDDGVHRDWRKVGTLRDGMRKLLDSDGETIARSNVGEPITLYRMHGVEYAVKETGE